MGRQIDDDLNNEHANELVREELNESDPVGEDLNDSDGAIQYTHGIDDDDGDDNDDDDDDNDDANLDEDADEYIDLDLGGKHMKLQGKSISDYFKKFMEELADTTPRYGDITECVLCT
jgi:hypothetical protein